MNASEKCPSHKFIAAKISATVPLAKQMIKLENAPGHICRECGEFAVNGKYLLELEEKLLAKENGTK